MVAADLTRWLPPRPINVYVIEHAKGLVLFDTGQDRASVTDDSYFPGGFTGVIYNRLARFHIGAGETLDAQLGTLGYSASDVDTAILSHLHQDHIGGITHWQARNCSSARPNGRSYHGSRPSPAASSPSTS